MLVVYKGICHAPTVIAFEGLGFRYEAPNTPKIVLCGTHLWVGIDSKVFASSPERADQRRASMCYHLSRLLILGRPLKYLIFSLMAFIRDPIY